MSDETAIGVWQRAVDTGEEELWTEHLDRVPVADHLAFVARQTTLRRDGTALTLAEFVDYYAPKEDVLADERETTARLALLTLDRWLAHVGLAVKESRIALPPDGVLQYFSDELALAILIGYRRIGSTIALQQFLSIPTPAALFDPLAALQHTRTDQQRDLLRRALFSAHKIVMHRNVLTYVNREKEPDVFGPTIDTLFLNEWLFRTRYAPARTPDTVRYFEDVIHKQLAIESADTGTAFLEIGSGNGLLTATFARNERAVRRLAAIDCSLSAIAATYRNSAQQRLLPHHGKIGDRARYVVAPYSSEAVPLENDLVVCNPPYIPTLDAVSARGHPDALAAATLGTALLEQVVSDAPLLLAPHGQLLIVISEMARIELEASVPTGWTCSRLAVRRVPFNVSAAHGQVEYLRRLCDERGLIATVAGGYEHDIAIYGVQRT